jgi:hypothetical protein
MEKSPRAGGYDLFKALLDEERKTLRNKINPRVHRNDWTRPRWKVTEKKRKKKTQFVLFRGDAVRVLMGDPGRYLFERVSL